MRQMNLSLSTTEKNEVKDLCRARVNGNERNEKKKLRREADFSSTKNWSNFSAAGLSIVIPGKLHHINSHNFFI